MGLLPSIITGRIVNEALVGKDMKLLVQLLIAAFITLTASQVIGVLESYINAWIANKIIYDMKNQMYGIFSPCRTRSSRPKSRATSSRA